MEKEKSPAESEQRFYLRVSCHGKDIAFIGVSEGEKTATIFFEHSGYKTVNVSEDSALAAIIDVCKELK